MQKFSVVISLNDNIFRQNRFDVISFMCYFDFYFKKITSENQECFHPTHTYSIIHDV